MKIIDRIFAIAQGDFGKRKLNKKYKWYWIRVTYPLLLVCATVIFFIALQIWQWIVNWTQYVYWGTQF